MGETLPCSLFELLAKTEKSSLAAAQNGAEHGEAMLDLGHGDGCKPQHQAGRYCAHGAGAGIGVKRQGPQFDTTRSAGTGHRSFVLLMAKVDAQIESAIGWATFEHIAKLVRDTSQQGRAALSVGFARALDMAPEMAFGDEVGQRHLRHDSRMAIDYRLGTHERVNQRRRCHQIT